MTSRNFTLGVTPDYQAHEWGLEEASREFISNALDAQTRGDGLCYVESSPRSNQLKITTVGVTLDPSVLLLGTSGSRNRDDCIGTFGEGLPMAIVTMCRLVSENPDMAFEIDNGQDRWRPEIAWSEKWGSDVVTVKVRQRRKLQPNNFTVTIKGICPETYKRLRDRFLALDPSFDSERTARGRGWESSNDRVLLQPEFVGRLYVKGVFVKHRDDLSYGYDLDMELNRDRSFVDEYDLRYRLQKLVTDVVASQPTKVSAEDVAAMIETPDNRLEFNGTSVWRLKESEALNDAVLTRFEDKHGGDAIPCANMAEARDLEAVGKRAAVVPRAVREIVEMTTGTAAQAIAMASSAPKAIHSWADLTDTQRGVLLECVGLVGMSFIAESDLLRQIQIVTFTDPKQRGSYAPADGQICLDLSILEDFRQTLDTLIHEVAHKLPDATDGSPRHEQGQLEIYQDIICKLAL